MQYLKSQVFLGAVALSSVLLLTACQPKSEATSKTETEQAAPASVTAEIPVIQAKVVALKLPQQQICDEEGCTAYDIQTVKTNVAWIDEYFMQRLQKADPIAFSEAAASTATPKVERNRSYATESEFELCALYRATCQFSDVWFAKL